MAYESSARKVGLLTALIVLSALVLVSIPATGETVIEAEDPYDPIPSEQSIADRVITPQYLIQGESSVVMISVTFDEPTDFTIVESFDAFADVDIIDDDGADFAAVTEANDELFATYGGRLTTTLVYEVTPHGDASPVENSTFNGFIDVAGEPEPIQGDKTVTVSNTTDPTPIRSIKQTEIEPGESAMISIEMTFMEPTNFTIIEGFDALAAVSIVDDDGADFAAVNDANNKMFATFGNRTATTLIYEVAVGDDPGNNQILFEGFAAVNGTQIDTVGDDTIEINELSVSSSPSPSPSPGTAPSTDTEVTDNGDADSDTGDDDTDSVDTDEGIGDDTVDIGPDEPDNDGIVHEERAEVVTDEETNQSHVVFSSRSTVAQIDFRGPVTGEITAIEHDPAAIDTERAPGSSLSVNQIIIPTDARNTSAKIHMQVTRDQIDPLGATFADLRMFRYVDDSWHGLDTGITSQEGDRSVLEAETPGFSFFSITAVSTPEAVIEGSTVATVDDMLTFDGEASSDQFGEIVQYKWNIDGSQYRTPTVRVVFDEPRVYTVELTVQNDAGVTDSATITLDVQSSHTETSNGDEELPLVPLLMGLGGVIAAISFGVWFWRK